MRSSISSSDALERISRPSHLRVLPRAAHVHRVQRDVPAHNWLAMGGVSLLVCALMVGVWERHVRAVGYQPDYDDTPSLWVKQREKASSARLDQLVLVGSRARSSISTWTYWSRPAMESGRSSWRRSAPIQWSYWRTSPMIRAMQA